MDPTGHARSQAASTSSSVHSSGTLPSQEPLPSSVRPAKANPEQVARLIYLMAELNTKVGEGTPTSVLELEEFMMLSRTMGIEQVKAAIAAANDSGSMGQQRQVEAPCVIQQSAMLAPEQR